MAAAVFKRDVLPCLSAIHHHRLFQKGSGKGFVLFDFMVHPAIPAVVEKQFIYGRM